MEQSFNIRIAIFKLLNGPRDFWVKCDPRLLLIVSWNGEGHLLSVQRGSEMETWKINPLPKNIHIQIMWLLELYSTGTSLETNKEKYLMWPPRTMFSPRVSLRSEVVQVTAAAFTHSCAITVFLKFACCILKNNTVIKSSFECWPVVID